MNKESNVLPKTSNVLSIYREFVIMDWALMMIREDFVCHATALGLYIFSYVMRVAFVRLNFFQTSEVFTRQLTKVTKCIFTDLFNYKNRILSLKNEFTNEY